MSLRPVAYRGSEPYVFISYAHRDSARIYPMIQGLQNRGFRVWYDEGLEVGSHWDEAISQHLSACDCVVCFITEGFLLSQNCLDEIHFAKELNKEPLIVYLDDVTPPMTFQFRYGRLHALRCSLSADDDALIDELTQSKAILRCRSSAPAIDPLTAFARGEAFYYGQGVDVDYAQAAKWYQISLSGGYPDAAEGLERCYECPEDDAEAEKWLLEAANAGDIRAQAALGELYWNRQLWDEDAECWLPKPSDDYREAIKWLKAASDNGTQEMPLRLARCYEMGCFVAQDNAIALIHYQRAVLLDPEDDTAQQCLRNFRERVFTTLSAEQCFQKGKSYVASGRYTNIELEEAAAWYRLAAEQGNVDAARELGMIYRTYLGPNLPKNNELAEILLQKAAEQNEVQAMFELGRLCEERFRRFGQASGKEKACEWYRRAANLGHTEARKRLHSL